MTRDSPGEAEGKSAAYCTECDAALTEESDVEFVDMDAEMGFFQASKRFYLVACGNCGAAIGGGVAGK